MPSYLKTLAVLAVAATGINAMPNLVNLPNLGNSLCAKYCKDNYAACGFKNVGQCVSNAAHNGFECQCCPTAGHKYCDKKGKCCSEEECHAPPPVEHPGGGSPSGPGNSGCAHYCQDNFMKCGFKNVGQCVSTAAHNGFECQCCPTAGHKYCEKKKKCCSEEECNAPPPEEHPGGGSPGNSGCAHYCKDNYMKCGFNNVGQCVSTAAHNGFECQCCPTAGHKYCEKKKKCCSEEECNAPPPVEHPPPTPPHCPAGCIPIPHCPVAGHSWCSKKSVCCLPADCH